jgi:predicted DNA-binding transcriptional regulator YafY
MNTLSPESENFEAASEQEERRQINVSAFRPIYLLRLLSQTNYIFFADLDTHFLNHPMIGRTVSRETINHYVNTLEMAQYQISRTEKFGHDVLKLRESPIEPVLTEEEMCLLSAVFDILAKGPLKSYYSDFNTLVNQLFRVPADYLPGNPFSDALPIIAKDAENTPLLECLERYCQEGQLLEISYETAKNGYVVKLIEPHQVICVGKQLYLVGNDPKTAKKIRYEIKRIRSHKQYPTKNRNLSLKTTVVFKLTGRLAKSYRPYTGEVVSEKDGCLLVDHATEEPEYLLKRLLKYGSLCEVISPDSACQQMLQMVQHLISGLDDSETALSKGAS